jgi:hypothetical protein
MLTLIDGVNSNTRDRGVFIIGELLALLTYLSCVLYSGIMRSQAPLRIQIILTLRCAGPDV